MLAGFGLLLAIGLVSGVGVGVLSSRQLARVPEMDVQQASLGDGVQEAWDRLRQIAQLDWRAAMEPRPAVASRDGKSADVADAGAAARAAMPSVSPEDAARRVAEVRQLSPHRTAVRAEAGRTVDATLTRFEQQGFDLADFRNSGGQLEVPRIFLAKLPVDMADVSITDKRKRAFIKVMLPHILREDERITADRERLQKLADRMKLGDSVSGRDQRWLEQLTDRYGLDEVDTNELLERVDIVPPGLALAQAIEESGWGTSRFAQSGNAVFGMWTWSAGSGLVPEDRPDGETYEVQRFRSLENSVAAYMRNLNTKASYREFRDRRAALRDQGAPLDSYQLAGQLHRYSARGSDYIRTIRSIMRSNGLDAFDEAKLADEPSPLLGFDLFGKS
jgi:Bax protein